MAENNKNNKIKSVMFGDKPTKPQLSEKDRQLLIDRGLNPEDFEYEDGYDPENPSAFVPPSKRSPDLSEKDRQLLIDRGLNPDDFEYVPGYDPNNPSNPQTSTPWSRQEGDTVYYDDDTPVSVKAVELEVPASIRAQVSALPKPEDRLKTLRKFYPDAQAVGTEQFIMRDPETGRPMVYNVEGWIPSWGDVAESGGEIAGTMGAIGGGAIGSAAGPVGTVAGGAAGYAAGKNLYQDGLNWYYGNEDTRDTGEYLTDVGTDALVGLTAEAGGALLGKGIKAGAGALKRNLAPSKVLGGRVAADNATDAAARLADFEAINIKPSPGMVGGSVAATREQGIAGNNQRVASGISDIYNQVEKKFGDTIESATGGRNLSAAEAGEAIQGRVRDFKDITKARSEELYKRAGELTEGIPASASNTETYIKSIKSEFNSLGNSGKLNAGSTYEDVLKQGDAILKDVRSGATFDTLKAARTAIGEIANDRNATNAVKRLYGGLYRSLSDDMTRTAEQAGNDALQAIKKANNFYRRTKTSGNLVSSDIPDEILKRQVPEAVYKMMLSNSRNAGSKVSHIVSQIRVAGGDDAVKEVGSVVFNRIGRDGSGNFSPAKLVKDWADLSPETKKALFMTSDGNALRKSMEDIVKVATHLVEYGSNRNHSNTSKHLLNGFDNFLTSASVAGAVSTASPQALLLPVLKAGGDNLRKRYQHKLFSDPETLKWMAGLNKGTQNGALSRLSMIYHKTADINTKIAIREYLNDLRDSK